MKQDAQSPPPETAAARKLGVSGRIAAAFQSSKLTPLIVIASLFLGLFAVSLTPREEDPQIIVPMVDVFVQAPGLSAEEVEQRVATPMEKLVSEIPGVEHVYSTSQTNGAMVIVRFEVGQDEEDSLVKLYNKLHGNLDRIPQGVSPPLMKLRSIDDVPVLAITLHSREYDHQALRQVAGEVATELKKVSEVSEITVIGGQQRQVRVALDPARLEAFQLSPLQVYQALVRDNQNFAAGQFDRGGRNFKVAVGDFFRNADEVAQTVVAVYGGRPVYLADVASIHDGAEEVADYVFFREGAAATGGAEPVARGADSWPFAESAAVTIAVAKRRSANATALTSELIDRLEDMRDAYLVSGIDYTITRDYGETAEEKSNELIFHMGLATISVVFLMGIFLGIKEAIVVAVAVPVTLALTLFSSWLFGYTLNRVTLFALIFAIGILVDDAIVVVENIHRNYLLKRGKLEDITPHAVDEVGSPTILATLTVIFALMPLAFVTGMMGPYMSPIPINASAAMLFSLLVAFVVTPWLTRVLLSFSEKRRARRAAKRSAAGLPEEPVAVHGERGVAIITKVYRGLMGPLVRHAWLRGGVLLGTLVLLGASLALLSTRTVKVKMLPHDDKSEFQVVIDMDEGATLEETAAVTREIGAAIARDPVVENVQLYVGTSAPINFNGLVRHYFLRRGPNVADIQVNLVDKHARDEASHDIAKRLRLIVTDIGRRWGASTLVAEVPPGPPVWSTMLAEIYGPSLEGQYAVAEQVKRIYEETPGVVDVDWFVEAAQPEFALEVDKAKAALSGVTTEQITNTIGLALYGKAAGLLHTERDREPVEIMLQVPRGDRSSVEALGGIKVHAADGRLVAIEELVRRSERTRDRAIHHKDQRRVVYVTGEVAGADESPVYGILDMAPKVDGIVTPDGSDVAQLYSALPTSERAYSLKWDGEWQITYEVFRDMGLAFAVVMLLIYIVVVAYFRSFVTPFIIMAPIPLTLVGILPGHWAMDTFFTATSMIGFIALAGIIVRNSILLVDFIEQELESGTSLEEAVLQAGAIRFRPIFLTAAALVVGGGVILLDPIFSGLAVSLIFGVVIATALTLVVIPLLYYMFRKAESRVRARRDRRAAVPAVAAMLAALLLASSVASAQTPAPAAPETSGAITLADAIRTAWENHPDLRRADVAVGRARLQADAARGAWGPTVTVESNVLVWDDELNATFAGGDVPALAAPGAGQEPQSGFDGYVADQLATLGPLLQSFGQGMSVPIRDQVTWGVTARLVQPLTPLYQVHQGHQARLRLVEQQQAHGRTVRADVGSAVATAFYAALQADAYVGIADSAVTQLEAHRRQAEDLRTQGLIPPSETLKVDVELANARQRVIEARAGRAIAQANLAAQMGLAPPGDVVPAGRPPAASDSLPALEQTLEESLEETLRRRSELEELALGLMAAEHGAKAGWWELAPKVVLVGQYDHVGGQGPFAPEDAAFAGLMLSWDVWEWGQRYYEAQAADAQVEEIALQRTRVEQLLRLDVTAKYYRVQSAREAFGVARVAIAQAEEALRVQKERFGAQVATSTDVLDAEAGLSRARANLVNAWYTWLDARAALDRAMGRPITPLDGAVA